MNSFRDNAIPIWKLFIHYPGRRISNVSAPTGVCHPEMGEQTKNERGQESSRRRPSSRKLHPKKRSSGNAGSVVGVRSPDLIAKETVRMAQRPSSNHFYSCHIEKTEQSGSPRSSSPKSTSRPELPPLGPKYLQIGHDGQIRVLPSDSHSSAFVPISQSIHETNQHYQKNDIISLAPSVSRYQLNSCGAAVFFLLAGLLQLLFGPWHDKESKWKQASYASWWSPPRLGSA
ncbi:hypothetical protein IV203_015007 [Nitzschia inconspicua]|uniref:Uncharacterized protein n=1 Tax=Nitzschia inconspicua TaxID=303405 RepID=A0A9K3LB35_9STRA|nr:hypothetical protein IV203_015007 [Nitzschia inconspicua]